MAASDIDEVCDSIATFLGAATGITTGQTFDALSEGVGDVPLMQVYPAEGTTDAWTQNDRLTFNAGRRVSETVFNADFYCRKRSNLDQDMAAVVAVQKNVQAKLETITTKPYFANASIKAFRWSWRVTSLQPGGASAGDYAVVRFMVTVRQF